MTPTQILETARAIMELFPAMWKHNRGIAIDHAVSLGLINDKEFEQLFAFLIELE